MKQIKFYLSVLIISILTSMNLSFGQTTFKVTVDEPVNGSVKLDPPVPANGNYPAGTKITVTSTPAPGFAFDAGYYSTPGRWGIMYYESMTPKFEVIVDQEKHIGASFIEKDAIAGIKVTQDVVYAKPGKKTLKYDVFAPEKAKNLPCIVIIHGGGWSSNTEDIMRGLARELVRNGRYVVFSIDYRWAGKLDGDEKGNTMANIIEDVFGAIAHIYENAAKYGGDPKRIGVTGDSAGGHLSAVAATMPNMIGPGGFGKTKGVFEFMPSYMPKNKTPEQVRNELMEAIKAAAPSYGVFAGLNHFSDDPTADDTWKNAVSPINHIPNVKDRAVPHYLTRGTKDFLIKDEMVKSYVDALVAAGQEAEYVQVGGAGHAFFDWKPDARTKETFYKYGVYYAEEMEHFFNSIFYKK